jgi:dolichyl-phosphate-mannose--protein O-mannosyl transferase
VLWILRVSAFLSLLRAGLFVSVAVNYRNNFVLSNPALWYATEGIAQAVALVAVSVLARRRLAALAIAACWGATAAICVIAARCDWSFPIP